MRFCAYLHNCRTPVFLRNDGRELAAFLKRFAGKGDRSRILYRIEHVRPRPSRNLADHPASLPGGNREFVMIDYQKAVYETTLEFMKRTEDPGRHVLLVEGGAQEQAGRLSRQISWSSSPTGNR